MIVMKFLCQLFSANCHAKHLFCKVCRTQPLCWMRSQTCEALRVPRP